MDDACKPITVGANNGEQMNAKSEITKSYL